MRSWCTVECGAHEAWVTIALILAEEVSCDEWRDLGGGKSSLEGTRLGGSIILHHLNGRRHHRWIQTRPLWLLLWRTHARMHPLTHSWRSHSRLTHTWRTHTSGHPAHTRWSRRHSSHSGRTGRHSAHPRRTRRRSSHGSGRRRHPCTHHRCSRRHSSHTRRSRRHHSVGCWLMLGARI